MVVKGFLMVDVSERQLYESHYTFNLTYLCSHFLAHSSVLHQLLVPPVLAACEGVISGR
jgi:hypothetical protein